MYRLSWSNQKLRTIQYPLFSNSGYFFYNFYTQIHTTYGTSFCIRNRLSFLYTVAHLHDKKTGANTLQRFIPIVYTYIEIQKGFDSNECTGKLIRTL